jgi:hypothetical protein
MATDIFAFDALIQNVDRRVTNPNLLTVGSTFYVYDHETSFSFLQAILPPPQPWIVENEFFGDSVEADQHSVLIAITVPGSI